MSYEVGSRDKTNRGRSKKRSAYQIALERLAECRAFLAEIAAEQEAEALKRRMRKQRRP